jgi:hypothetical protein
MSDSEFVYMLQILVGFFAIVTCIQIFHFRERRKVFLESPQLEELIEDYYMQSASSLVAYQQGEITEARKVELREQLMKELAEDPQCPLSFVKFSNTIVPCLFFIWPVKFGKWLHWRITDGFDPVAEAERIEREERERVEREEREAAEERQRQQDAKDAIKAEKAKILEERLRKEEEQKQRWFEEAQAEAEAEKEEPEELIVDAKVCSVEDLRKKGQYMVEVSYGSGKTAQLVVDRNVEVGHELKVALEGAVHKGKQVKRTKVAGEFNEGIVIDWGTAGTADTADTEAMAEEEQEESQTRQRKKDKKKK